MSWVPHPGGFEGTDGRGTSAIGETPEPTAPSDHLLTTDAQDGVDTLMRKPRLLVEAILWSTRCRHAAADPQNATAIGTMAPVDAQQDWTARGAEHLPRRDAAVAAAVPGLGYHHGQAIDRVAEQWS